MLANRVAATPSPTDPVEKSTSSSSLVRDGYAWAPPNARNRSRFSRLWRPKRYWMAWNAGLAWGFTATRSPGRRTAK